MGQESSTLRRVASPSPGAEAEPQPWRTRLPDDVMDAGAVLADIETAIIGGDLPDDGRRGAIVDILAAGLAEGRETIADRFRAAPLSGRVTARAYSRLTEQVVSLALEAVTRWIHVSHLPTTSERLSVLAVGGFGRGDMAPFSDVDLLFLTPYKQTAWGESVIESALYILWDLKLKVGQSVRTVEDCLRLGGTDFTIRTSLLERRLIWGDSDLAHDLAERLRSDLFEKTGPEFVEAKLAERANRHDRQGGSRYLVEPNVKEGKGGLRDLQTLYWIGKYLYQVETTGALVAHGLLTEDEQDVFDAAEAFFWSVRCHLHLLAKRPVEQLTFDMQVEVAAAMGFEDADGQRGVERFMQVYFLHARSVGELSRIIFVALEAEHIAQTPTLGGRIRRMFGFSRDTTPEGFEEKDGRITVSDEADFLADPVNILRLFRVGIDTDMLIHPDALRLAAANLHLIDEAMRADPVANQVFVDLMIDTESPERALRRMNETGVLGAFLPEFGRIVAMMQFNMYHHYTVDEHTITCIGILSRIEQGELVEDLPVASSILKSEINRTVLYVALLLHDIGKGRPEDHSELGAEIAGRICPRIGLSDTDTATVVWLVRNHLLMSDVAQKRDISDPRTIADFASTVASTERLKLLLVLTVCDIKGVGPNTWNNWKAMLLRELYASTREVLTGGIDSLKRDTRVAEAQAAFRAALGRDRTALYDQEVVRHYMPYWLGLDTDTHLAVAGLSETLAEGEIESAFSVDAERDATKAVFFMADHPGIFSRLAGALAIVGANVKDARTYTTSDGFAATVFWIQDGQGAPYEAGRLDRLTRSVARTLKGEVVAREALEPKDKLKKRERDFRVPTVISFDNQGSDIFTIIEVDTRDRPGLLHDLTRALTIANVNIYSAIIATYGEQAVDTFYVKNLFGMKLDTLEKRRSVEGVIRDAINRWSPED
ncbi:MAG: [protein-PII] uridylyltransferase [Pseudomonadota bacterium]